ncbi:HAD domain-containing protein [Streptosporangium sp. NPDC050855]|uniref:HAD domain-containing protein n=1 Tax=Streptosporangium sp. NPDC050855 TaxID=3366194 RepID=UPI00378F8746
MKPYLVMDVDGVINPTAEEPRGYRRVAYPGSEQDGYVWVNDDHVRWLAEVLPRVELVWATSWSTEMWALRWLAKELGLPEDLPCIDVGKYGGVTFGRTAKIGPVEKYIGDRPTVWIDDVFGGKDWGWALDRTEEGIPTLLINPPSHLGLGFIDMGRVLAWLDEQENG